MAKTIITDDQIRYMTKNVDKMSLTILVKTVNVLRRQKSILPPVELEFLDAIENEIKRRNNG